MVEHSWAPLTMWLTGLQLRATIPGEGKTPQEQTNLTPKEREIKEAAVLNTAINDVHRCLEGRVYDSQPATFKIVTDNVDLRICARQETPDRGTKDLHYCNCMAVKNRVQTQLINCLLLG